MQNIRPARSRFRAILTLVIIAAIIALVVFLALEIMNRSGNTGVTAAKLPCEYNDSIKAFGDYILYYDGESIHCMSATGAVRWTFRLGPNAGFDCNDSTIAAWTGNTIYILDKNGNSSYNDNLGEAIQFARTGTQYVAAVIGENTSPRLVVKDHSGAHMDLEADAYQDLLMLDAGFYGRNGEYMWTLALDVFGTASNTLLNTFEVGKMNTGEVSLGEPITYRVIYENSKLRVINTRKMLTFNYRGTEDATAAVLVYGWRLIDDEAPERGDAMMLFAPTTQTESIFDIRELRLVTGSTDKRYSLPATCIGAVVSGGTVYAISETKLFCAALSDNRFESYDLPLSSPATRFIDKLASGRAIIACDSEVYSVTLPEIKRLRNARIGGSK